MQKVFFVALMTFIVGLVAAICFSNNPGNRSSQIASTQQNLADIESVNVELTKISAGLTQAENMMRCALAQSQATDAWVEARLAAAPGPSKELEARCARISALVLDPNVKPNYAAPSLTETPEEAAHKKDLFRRIDEVLKK